MKTPCPPRWAAVLLGAAAVLIPFTAFAQTPPANPAPAPAPASGPAPGEPIKALLVTGGCCHDYNNQALIIPKGLSARANITWTVVNQGGTSSNAKIPLYEDPKWAEPYDVIVHNECFAEQRDIAWLDRILEPHRNGKPALIIHCGVHCYRVGTDAWFEFVGVQSPNHGAQYAHVVENRKPDHPIMKGFGESWTTSNGELYNIIKVFPTCTPLGVSKRRPDNAEQVCVWTNDYRGARVFGTTIGHHNDTMLQPEYLNMLSRGLLWAVHGDKAPDIKTDVSVSQADAETTKLIAQANVGAQPVEGECCQDGNLLLGRPVEVSSTAENSVAKNALDGNMATNWQSAAATEAQWLKVDLQEAKNIRWLRVQGVRTAPSYTIESSTDGETWTQVADGVPAAPAPGARGRGPARPRFMSHEVNLANVRYLRLNLPAVAAFGGGGRRGAAAGGADGAGARGAGGDGAGARGAGGDGAPAAGPAAGADGAGARDGAPAGGAGPAAPAAGDGAGARRAGGAGARRGGRGGPGAGASGVAEFEAYSDKMPDLPTPPQQFATLADVTAPEGFTAQIFGMAPTVNYPVCLTTSENGEVFVGVDLQGSLGKEPNQGKILRMVDVDGDGKADQVSQFAAIDHPRGLVYSHGKMWVLAPPKLVLLEDTNGDGVSDSQKTLIDNITTEQLNIRGADHTTNGIRMGIDGWIYVAVGDFGFVNATGTDGRKLSHRGGGVLRVRPDGTEMELFATGLRNIVDIAVDPLLNLFTRDNTNDGQGWNIRVSHIMQGAYYGYPSRFVRFTDETMPPLQEYGGGSGCGVMSLYDPRWPAEYNNVLLTADWGTNKIYRHRLPQAGATYLANQDEYLTIPRPTDLDLDVNGRLYITSWKGGSYNYSGENVGFVAQVMPKDYVPKPLQKLTSAGTSELVQMLRDGSAAIAFHAQHELLRRGATNEVVSAVWGLTQDSSAPMQGRVAGLETWHQLAGAKSRDQLLALAKSDAAMRRHALRALTDRESQLNGVTPDMIASYLSDPNPEVQAQALISLARLGKAGKVQADQVKALADVLLPLSVVRSEDGSARLTTPKHSEGDAPRALPHLAVRALVDLGAAASCVSALGGPNQTGAVLALKQMHTQPAVDGLIAKYGAATDAAQKVVLLDLLARLYNTEAEYTNGRDWWNTKPDTSGPYYVRVKWAGSDKIADVLKPVLSGSDSELKSKLQASLDLYKVRLDGAAAAPVASAVVDKPIEMAKADPNNPNQIANRNKEEVAAQVGPMSGDAAKGKLLFTSQSCVACHTVEEGQLAKGPHLKDIGKRYNRVELVDSILNPSKKLAQGFESWLIATDDGKIYNGFILNESAETVVIRSNQGVSTELAKDKIEQRRRLEESMMPAGIVGNLTAEQFSDLVTYLESLK